MNLADRVFLFKRAVRETALRHGVFATFMAKPMEARARQCHAHPPEHCRYADTGQNIFSRRRTAQGSATLFHAVHRRPAEVYIPQVMPVLAPYVNSYRRLSPYMSAPINVRWGHDNRTCGIRIPKSGPQARRVENRVPGVDTNPYLAMAATLACGWLGMHGAAASRQPSPP